MIRGNLKMEDNLWIILQDLDVFKYNFSYGFISRMMSEHQRNSLCPSSGLCRGQCILSIVLIWDMA